MEAKASNLLRFLDGTKQFFIPKYQRPYSWEIKQCNQLWNDILNAPNKGYFIGSIVYIGKGLQTITAVPEFLVIDGQQRLTTISLLLYALSEAINENGKLDLGTDQVNSEKIKGYYLFNSREEGDMKYKLLLSKKDKEIFMKLLEGVELGEAPSNIKRNYEFFKSKIAKSDLKKVYEGIAKLMIIDVALDYDKDNPQLIFESLNSTGLDLTQSDLIRNFVLMGLEKEKQDELYSNYWYPMEEMFLGSDSRDEFDYFVRDYLTMKTKNIPKVGEVYEEYKRYISENKLDIYDAIKELNHFAKLYTNMIFSKSNSNLDETFTNLKTLKVDVAYPFLLKIYEDYNLGKISLEDFGLILKNIESYVFRRLICGIPTNSMNKTFATLYSEIESENFIESLLASLQLKDSYRRFPTDEEFSNELLTKDVYNLRNRNYLLRKLENNDRKEIVNVESYTIEHIMPQKEGLTPEWKEELGDNWKEVHEKYLHTLGNLTLTGYNSELSCKPFKEKQNMVGGFKDSPIRLNRDLALIDSWNEDKILERAKKLAKLCSEIWKAPNLSEEVLSKYKKMEETTQKDYVLEDHTQLAEGEPMRPVFEELRKRILNIDSSVREEILKLYIAYKNSTNFVDIIPQKSKLNLTINLKFDEIEDPKGLCKDITGQGRWGNGDIRFSVSSMEDLDYAMFLINQSYEKHSE